MTVAVVAACDALIPALDMRKRRNEMPRNETADLSIDEFKICQVFFTLLILPSGTLLCLSRPLRRPSPWSSALLDASIQYPVVYVFALMSDGSPGEIRTPVDGSLPWLGSPKPIIGRVIVDPC